MPYEIDNRYRSLEIRLDNNYITEVPKSSITEISLLGEDTIKIERIAPSPAIYIRWRDVYIPFSPSSRGLVDMLNSWLE